jgi:hypothetical protein
MSEPKSDPDSYVPFSTRDTYFDYEDISNGYDNVNPAALIEAPVRDARNALDAIDITQPVAVPASSLNEENNNPTTSCLASSSIDHHLPDHDDNVRNQDICKKIIISAATPEIPVRVVPVAVTTINETHKKGKKGITHNFPPALLRFCVNVLYLTVTPLTLTIPEVKTAYKNYLSEKKKKKNIETEPAEQLKNLFAPSEKPFEGFDVLKSNTLRAKNLNLIKTLLNTGKFETLFKKESSFAEKEIGRDGRIKKCMEKFQNEVEGYIKLQSNYSIAHTGTMTEVNDPPTYDAEAPFIPDQSCSINNNRNVMITSDRV